MEISKITWFASLFIASITINATLLKIITSDKIPRPNWAALFINVIVSLIGGIFGDMLLGIIPSATFVLFNVFSFLGIVYIVKRRDTKAVILGEKLLAVFRRIDLQICYILSEMLVHPTSDIGKPIRRTIRYVLAELSNILGLDATHHAQLIILIPEGYKFKVLAYSGIPSDKLAEIENTFKYGPEPISLAGEAMNRRVPIIINDLSDESLPETAKWVRISPDEKREGSILVYPFMRGLGPSSGDPIAELCIASEKKDAFDIEAVTQILAHFSPKLEVLQNCWDIFSASKKE
ncbi:MAG: GAF domain-containing protein [Anaerolineales bacterium]|nr:GAF domain-containing protein [Anaerolineales bacterium]